MYKKVRLIMEDMYCGGSISCEILADEEDMAFLEALDGKDVDFGEYRGKHSEVSGRIDLSMMEVEDISDEEAKIVIKHSGKVLSGASPFDYIVLREMFTWFYEGLLEQRIFTIFSDEQLDKLDELLSNGMTKVAGEERYKDYEYVLCLEDKIPIKEVVKWDTRIEELEDVDALTPEELVQFDSMMRLVVDKL